MICFMHLRAVVYAYSPPCAEGTVGGLPLEGACCNVGWVSMVAVAWAI